ncbi:MAG: PhzF family phenazine biosynthesis isomerase [Colwellia sp.]|nr:PhzF family phenazine biosynthesis isomerase [Colwellia sp.]
MSDLLPLNLQKRYRTYQVFHLNVFTRQTYSGNSATVVWHSNGISHQQMQILAREFNTSETIFITIHDNKLSLHFFTPNQEVSSCGHGTLAAAHVAFKHLDKHINVITFNTAIGNITLHQSSTPYAEYKYSVPIPKLETYLEKPKSIINALSNAEIGIINSYIVNTGNGQQRLLLQCKSKTQLLSLAPNFTELLQSLDELNLFSVFVFSINNQSCTQISARMFAPNIGINEDPVNGNSSIALSCVIHDICKTNKIKCPQRYNVHQGEPLNKRGKTTVFLKFNASSLLKVELAGCVVELYNYNLTRLPG